MRAARMLGFDVEKVKQGLVVREIGNTYSGSSLIGLSAVLDVAKPEERILLVSFGSGAGSDAFALRVTDEIEDFPRNPGVWEKISFKKYVDYGLYLKHRGKIKV
jgi:hydroxymethylglutaryl-CoA synthase